MAALEDGKSHYLDKGQDMNALFAFHDAQAGK